MTPMQNPYDPPEVKAARSAVTLRQRQAATIPVRAPIGPTVEALFRQMLDAHEVFILGSLPWECSQRLITLQHERLKAAAPPPVKTVHYFIPERDAKYAGATMGPRIQRWIAGLFGVRNWIVPDRDDDTNRDTLIMHIYRYDAGGCTVLIRTGDYFAAASINYLPVAIYPTAGVLTIAPYEADQRDVVREHIFKDLIPNSRRYEIRQVRCIGPNAETAKDSGAFTPQVLRLTTRRKLNPTETEPAVVIAVCGHTSRGPVVMLKQRNRANSIDDFDKLSLVSEHVIVDDLVSWVDKLRQPLNEDDTLAQEQLWTAAGRPNRLVLEQQFFAEAAQRELFISCGLNVASERLRFCGYRRVDREDQTHLGFAVFRLDLIQTDDLDELQIVRSWSRDMVEVPIPQLYQDPYLDQLNRLLRLQQPWLLKNIFSPRSP